MTSTSHSTSVRRCVVLIGLRGSGKSVVGRALATLLDGDCVDTDDVVAAEAGMTIAAIFESEGVAGFRRRESDAVGRAIGMRPAVISVGGGAVLDDQNVVQLKGAGDIVWLSAPVEVLHRRIEADGASVNSRPPLTGLGKFEELRQLAAEREGIYSRVADLVVETYGRTPGEVAAVIRDKLGRAYD